MVREYDLLAETVENTLRYQGKTSKSCGKVLGVKFGVSSSCAEAWVNFARKGHIYGTPGIPKKPMKQLERMSHFLQYLGISSEAEVIKGIQERDEKFRYPPEKECETSRISSHDLEVLLRDVKSNDYPAVRDYLTGIISEY